MTIEQLRTVVASLRAAVAFSRALSASMPSLAQLLASSTLTDVQVRSASTRRSKGFCTPVCMQLRCLTAAPVQ